MIDAPPVVVGAGNGEFLACTDTAFAFRVDSSPCPSNRCSAYVQHCSTSAGCHTALLLVAGPEGPSHGGPQCLWHCSSSAAPSLAQCLHQLHAATHPDHLGATAPGSLPLPQMSPSVVAPTGPAAQALLFVDLVAPRAVWVSPAVATVRCNAGLPS